MFAFITFFGIINSCMGITVNEGVGERLKQHKTNFMHDLCQIQHFNIYSEYFGELMYYTLKVHKELSTISIASMLAMLNVTIFVSTIIL